jgi:2-oxoglutarate ferredoxin oxidoreductase subunit alpha
MNEKVLMCGNEVVGEAAIRAGCRFYAGYPITPQNELTAYMARKMPEEGGVFIQAESELAAISMVFGASLAGARAMTSSSSPGISLKQEGISYLTGNELPAVIVNMMRGGPGLGNIAPAQSDYFQATKGGGHGDYNLIVLGPATVQELAELVGAAFDLADRYRNPVLILGDGILGQMMEPVEIKKRDGRQARRGKQSCPEKDWILTGAKGRPPRIIRSLILKEGELEEHNRHLQDKFRVIKEKEILYEEEGADDAEIILVAYGTTARIAKAALNRVRSEGIKAGIIRPITLWPFPEKVIADASSRTKCFLVIEMSAGQMVEDVRLAVSGNCPVHFHGSTGGGVPTAEEISQKIRELV